jgi:uncharacterized membrane protein SpoIIM required for sporulation
MSIAIWTKASPRRKRILSTLAVFIVALAITAIGTAMPIDQQQANQISDDLNQTVTSLNDNGVLLQYIFGNNFLICLLMFVPIIGPLLGFFIMFNTGTVIGAIAAAGGFPPALALVSLFLTPVAWLEFAAYSTAMAESVWLMRRFLQRLALRELRKSTILISITAVLLAVAAIVEVVIISIGL